MRKWTLHSLAFGLTLLLSGCLGTSDESGIDDFFEVDTGVGNPALTFSPELVDFGEVVVNQFSTPVAVTVTNSSEETAFISTVSNSNSDQFLVSSTNCAGLTLAPGATCEMSLSFVPKFGGAQVLGLIVSYGVELDKNTELKAVLPLKGSGASSISFGGLENITNVGGTSMQLNWNHVAGASSYTIYRVNNDSTTTLLSTVAAPTNNFVVSGLNVNTVYTHRVRALDQIGLQDTNKRDISQLTLPNPPPTLTLVSPDGGALAGVNTITMTGTGFQVGVELTIDGQNCALLTRISDTSLQCVTVARPAGSYDVVITNPDGQSVTLSNGFTYRAAPDLTSVSPTKGTWQGGDTLSLTGTGFITGMSATVGGVACASVSVTNSTTASCVTPARAGGLVYNEKVAVAVTNTDTQTDSIASAFTYSLVQGTLFVGATDPQGAAEGSATASRFDNIEGLFHEGGYVYGASYDAHVVFRVNTANGESEILAGRPYADGYINGPAGTGQLYNPYGVVKVGNSLFVAERRHVIREVNLTDGSISHFAGVYNVAGTDDGPATTAKFNLPRGLVSDGTSLFVSDYTNDCIRKVDIATGAVSTLAGLCGTGGFADGVGAAARFNQPAGMLLDGSDLYIAERDNHRVRHIDLSDSTVSTIAGTGSGGHTNGAGATARFRSPMALGLDPSGGTDGYLYVADDDNEVIRRIDLSDNTVSTVAGQYNQSGFIDGASGAAKFTDLTVMAFDSNYLYAADNNNVIRRVNLSTFDVDHLSGHSTAPGKFDSNNSTGVTGTSVRFNSINASVLQGDSLFITDYNREGIREVNLDTGLTTSFTGNLGNGSTDGLPGVARFKNPYGLVSDGTYLWVTDYDNHTIRRVTLSNGEVTTVAGSVGVSGSTDAVGGAARFKNPYGIAEDGTYLYVSELGNDIIRRIHKTTFNVITIAGTAEVTGDVDGTGAAVRFNNPYDLQVVGSYLYIADNGNHKIRRIHTTTLATTTYAGRDTGYLDHTTPTDARFRNPRGLGTDGTHLFVADYGNHAVRAIHLTTHEVTSVTANAQPAAQTTDNVSVREQPGTLDETMTLRYPYDVSYDASRGLWVNTRFAVYRLY